MIYQDFTRLQIKNNQFFSRIFEILLDKSVDLVDTKYILFSGAFGMAKEMTETQSVTKTPKIEASSELWAVFENWCARMGCQTLPEGLRAAMRQVTNFNGQSQEKNAEGMGLQEDGT